MSRRTETVYDERDYYSGEASARPPPARVRERDYEEVDIYTRRSEPNRPEFLRDDYGRRADAGPMVVRERETDIYTRPVERRPRSPSPVRVRERIIERERSLSPPPVDRIRTRVVTSERSPSPEPERLRKRVIETRERIRERSPSPPPPVRIRERVIERERERSLSPPRIERVSIRETRALSRAPSPSIISSRSPSPPPSIRAPPIHQEIITHHRHIDHGLVYERARAPSPPPPPRRTNKETDIDIYTSRNNTEIDIKQSSSSSRSRTPAPTSRRDPFYDDDMVYEQERDRLRVGDTRVDISRQRSTSARPPPVRERERVRVDIGNDDEADFYARKVEERSYVGEAYNGATKDWAIVDVPPGTERVRLDGVGGGGQEITWQRYNGVRRSKFIPERERTERLEIKESSTPRRESSGLEIEISSKGRREGGRTYEREYERIEESSDRRVGMPRGPKNKMGDLWTEITKDLVVKDAIESLGYDYEETDYFFYVMQYLRYEDVLELVQLSETIRRERQDRLREIERERLRIERKEREREEWERAERRRDRDRDAASSYDDERIIEREVIYNERRGPRTRW